MVRREKGDFIVLRRDMSQETKFEIGDKVLLLDPYIYVLKDENRGNRIPEHTLFQPRCEKLEPRISYIRESHHIPNWYRISEWGYWYHNSQLIHFEQLEIETL